MPERNCTQSAALNMKFGSDQKLGCKQLFGLFELLLEHHLLFGERLSGYILLLLYLLRLWHACKGWLSGCGDAPPHDIEPETGITESPSPMDSSIATAAVMTR